jgi:signal peptidase I
LSEPKKQREILAQEKKLSTSPITPEGATAEDLEEKETALESLASICTVLVVGLFLMAFAFQNFEIPSASMQNTLLIGDHLVVDRVTLAPATKWAPIVHYRPVQRGDIIVFYKPNPEQPDLILVKRCIGLPGDKIHLEHGIVYLNGVAQNEPYAIMPDDGNPLHVYNAYRDEFPHLPPSFPRTLLMAILLFRPVRSSPWATTAQRASTVATGVLCRMKTLSAAPCSSTGPSRRPKTRKTRPALANA